MKEQLRSRIVKALMDNEIGIANKLLMVDTPKSLFKYRLGDQRDIDSLKENKVWVGRALFLDDEEDARFRVKNVDTVCSVIDIMAKYSLQGTTQGRYLTGGVPPVRFSM